MAVIHDERELHFAFDLAEDISHDWIEKKLADLVLNGRYRLAHESLVVRFVFLSPKRADDSESGGACRGRTGQVKSITENLAIFRQSHQ